MEKVAGVIFGNTAQEYILYKKNRIKTKSKKGNGKNRG